MRADYVVTEAGGFQMPTPRGPRLPVIVGEKGSYWCRITVRGTPGHASQPFRTDNALVTAAEIVRRLAEYRPPTQIHDTWRRFIEGVDFGPEWNAHLLDEATLADFCEELPIGLARQAHACTHTTFAPTVIHGGTKTNVIPDTVELEVDIRTLPGQRSADIQRDARRRARRPASRAPRSRRSTRTSRRRRRPTRRCGTRWAGCRRSSSKARRSCRSSPSAPPTRGSSAARGSVAYGFGLFSRKLSFDDYASMFHGNDERVDIESLVLSTRLWEGLARDLLG